MTPTRPADGRWAAVLGVLGWASAAGFGCATLHENLGRVLFFDEWRAAVGALVGLHAAGLAVALVGHALLRRPLVRWGLAVVPLLVAAGWGTPAVVPATAHPAAGDGPDIVLVTIDTLRADHVGVYGGAPTPALDAFAARARRFDAAVSPIPLTLPAHAALFTGRSPEALGLVSNGGRLAAAGTLATELHAAGWATAAFVGARVLDRSGGLDAGFDHYDDRWGADRDPWRAGRRPRSTERPADAVVGRAMRWLDTPRDRPRFLWVHVYDPHAPYVAPDDAVDRRPRVERRAAGAMVGGEGWVGDAFRYAAVGDPLARRAAYAAEVAWTDRALAPLLATLPDDAVVVVAADHGEGLGEHDAWFTHGPRLHEPALRVPLLVRWPGRLAPGSVEEGLVTLTDVAPLVRAAAGLTADPGPLVAPPPGRGVPVVTSGQSADSLGTRAARGPRAGTRWSGDKLVSEPGGATAWFDLVADPSEQAPALAPAHRAAAAADGVARAAGMHRLRAGDDLERLRVLGYVEP